MSGSGHPEATVRAKVERRRGIAPIWLIPLATVLVAAYLVWHEFNSRGPLIQVGFRTAEGLTAGQSQLRIRDVAVGKVETIGLTPDPIMASELPSGLAPTPEGWLRTDPAMLADEGGLDGFFIARWRA